MAQKIDPKVLAPDYDPADEGEPDEAPAPRNNMVPLAERPFAPPDGIETARETVWQNVTGEPITLDVYVGHPQVLPHPKRLGRPLTWEERTAKRRYIIPARGKRAVPSEFDAEIQRNQCLETECSQNPLGCTDVSHRKMTVGGLCPQGLVNMGLQVRPILAPGLDDLAARQAEERQKTIDAVVRREQDAAALTDANKKVAELQALIAKRDAELEAATAPTKPVASTQTTKK